MLAAFIAVIKKQAVDIVVDYGPIPRVIPGQDRHTKGCRFEQAVGQPFRLGIVDDNIGSAQGAGHGFGRDDAHIMRPRVSVDLCEKLSGIGLVQHRSAIEQLQRSLRGGDAIKDGDEFCQPLDRPQSCRAQKQAGMFINSGLMAQMKWLGAEIYSCADHF